MKSASLATLATIVAFGLGNSAFASSYECDSGPESEWKSKDEAKAFVLSEGYEVRKIKTEGGCYEVYAKKNGKRLELFINPSTLEIEKIEED